MLLRPLPVLILLTILVIQYEVFLTLYSNFGVYIPYKIQTSLSQLVFESNVKYDIARTVFFFLFFHFFIVFYIVFIAKKAKSKYKLNNNCELLISLLMFILIYGSIFFLNSIFFPNSVFVISFLDIEVSNPTKYLKFFFVSFLIVLLIFPTLIFLERKNIKLYMIFLFLSIVFISNYETTNSFKSIENKKNIFVIGIDSLSYQYLEQHSEQLPFLKKIIHQGVLFDNSYVQIGRTYPSWISMLSGKYPKTTNVRINLSRSETLNKDLMLPKLLQNKGYKTFYAIDETRFSNIDNNYGFDYVVKPESGAGDFLLGSFSDFPFANLLSVFSIVENFFPFVYLNRASIINYYPSNYNEEVKKTLSKYSKKSEEPIFMAMHYCLPHWPYSWANKVDLSFVPEKGYSKQEFRYQKALEEVDRQIEDIYYYLQSNKFLQNSIVVFTSDHGESFGIDFESDNLNYINAPDKERISYFGHGSNIFSEYQNNTFFSFLFDNDEFKKGQRTQLVGNIDLAATLLELAGENVPQSFDGISLLPWIKNIDKENLDRSLFIETGFFLPALMNSTPKLGDMLAQGLSFYDITEDGFLRVNNKKTKIIIDGKQLGIISNDYVLGLVPRNTLEYVVYLLDKKQNIYQELTQTNFQTDCNQQCKKLFSKLITYYKDDIAASPYKLNIEMNNNAFSAVGLH